jgi:hypothetical protein
MLEFERNSPIETGLLAEFFARCGWQELEADCKLEWVLAASEEWVTCKLDGELIGFGRSCRLGPVKRIVFDVTVDGRFDGTGLRGEIVRLLSENAGSLEEVSVFTKQDAYPLGSSSPFEDESDPLNLPEAAPGTYLGPSCLSSTDADGRPE